MKQDLEIRQCRVLIAVADKGGIVRAAAALGTAQSTVSEVLFSLERLLDKAVVTRRRGEPATLTDVAHAILPHARNLVAYSEAAIAHFESFRGTAVRLGAIESVSAYLLPPTLRALNDRGLDYQLQITTGLCDDLRSQVIGGGLDAALTLQPAARGADNGELRSRPLGVAEIWLVASPHSEFTGAHMTPKSLADLPMLLPDPEGAFNEVMARWYQHHSIAPRTSSAGTIDGVKRSAALGIGIGVLPSYAVQEEVSAGELVRLSLSAALPQLSLEAVSLSTAENPAFDALCAELASQLLSIVDNSDGSAS